MRKDGQPKPIALALQGGGAHGAFTWGVLDALLEDERLVIAAISGTSAGAMNAVALAEGYAEGGREGARAQLRAFWERVSDRARYSLIHLSLFDRLLGRWDVEQTPGFYWFEWLMHYTSPYVSNPLDLNPLRDILGDEIDFNKVRACSAIRLFIAATNVATGRVEVFDQTKLDARHILASAALPEIFQAVEIDGESYWDGGYVGNPALFPLFQASAARDLLIVQITRMIRREVPKSAQAIENRLREITFNASLVGELRAIEFVQRLVDQGAVPADRYRRLLMHRIDADAALADLKASSKLNAERDFLELLFERGRKAARSWLAENFKAIGQHDTLDLRALLKGTAV